MQNLFRITFSMLKKASLIFFFFFFFFASVFDSRFFSLIALYRGYMQDCYHKNCDSLNAQNTTKTNYQTLVKITEALALTVIELTAQEQQCAIATEQVVQAQDIEEKLLLNSEKFYDTMLQAFDSFEANEIADCKKDQRCFAKAEKVYSQMSSFLSNKDYLTNIDPSPTFSTNGGTQININNLNIGIGEGKGASLESIAGLIKRAYEGDNDISPQQPLKAPRNSPMFIKVGN